MKLRNIEVGDNLRHILITLIIIGGLVAYAAVGGK